MKKTLSMGMNRTGIAMAPNLTEEMRNTEALKVGEGTETRAPHVLRMQKVREADPIGTIPLPLTLRGGAGAIGKRLSGQKLEILLDKLGERLAFERTGTRLYELMLNKARSEEADLPEGTVFLIETICQEEKRHFQLVAEILIGLGADPTSMTPSADLTAVQSAGLLAVAADPRVPFLPSLEVLRTAELIDNDAWDSLILLAEAFGVEQIEPMRAAKLTEERHLRSIRNLADNGLAVAAGLELETEHEKAVG